MSISDWISDVCSSDLIDQPLGIVAAFEELAQRIEEDRPADQEALRDVAPHHRKERQRRLRFDPFGGHLHLERVREIDRRADDQRIAVAAGELEHEHLVDLEFRSEEHTSELQSLMRISYAVFCLTKKNNAARKDSTVHK